MLRLLKRDMFMKRLFHHHSRFSSITSTKGRLEGKIALITGGASGIGKATAQEFVQQGAYVLIADINSELGLKVAQDLGPSAHFIRCDVADEAQVAQAVDKAVAQHGKLDIMYNNAGIVGPMYPSIADLDMDQLDQVIRINVRGTIAGIKHAARVMIPASTGSILCTASVTGVLGGLGPHPYSISKFTIPGVVKSVASELCKHGVRINCISPSTIATPMVMEQLCAFYSKATKEKVKEIVENLEELKGANCEEKDVAKAALYLASEDAKYVTGHNLVVDGGFTCFKHFNLPSPDQIV